MTICSVPSSSGPAESTGPVFQLEAKRAEILAHMAALRGDVNVECVAEEAEAAMLRSSRDAVAQEMNLGRISLAMVEAALERVRRGTYGFCTTCNKPISAKRLAAVCDAARCISCAEDRVTR